MDFWPIIESLVLLAVANGAPVITKDLIGDRFAWPVDIGASFFDGRPLFGHSKTFRGIVVSILATSACSALISGTWRVGAVIASVAMAGDLLSSFTKRRLNVPPSGKATGLDQIPESFFPLLAVRGMLELTWREIAVVTALFFLGEVLLSRVLYRLHLRERPY